MKKQSFAENHIIYGTEEQVVFPNYGGEEYALGKTYSGAHKYVFLNCIGYTNGKTNFLPMGGVHTKCTQEIQFIHKSPDGTITPGLQSEQLLVCLIDRTLKLDVAFPCAENKDVIYHLMSALDALEKRVKNRENAGVMGELKNHDESTPNDVVSEINRRIQVSKEAGIDASKVSDGYHTFEELYDFRNILTVLVFNSGKIKEAYRSKKHADGTMYDGYFILGGSVNGKQVSFHLPIKYWSMLFCVKILTNAPEWDGHTSEDVLVSLHMLASENITKSNTCQKS